MKNRIIFGVMLIGIVLMSGCVEEDHENPVMSTSTTTTIPGYKQTTTTKNIPCSYVTFIVSTFMKNIELRTIEYIPQEIFFGDITKISNFSSFYTTECFSSSIPEGVGELFTIADASEDHKLCNYQFIYLSPQTSCIHTLEDNVQNKYNNNFSMVMIDSRDNLFNANFSKKQVDTELLIYPDVVNWFTWIILDINETGGVYCNLEYPRYRFKHISIHQEDGSNTLKICPHPSILHPCYFNINKTGKTFLSVSLRTYPYDYGDEFNMTLSCNGKQQDMTIIVKKLKNA